MSAGKVNAEDLRAALFVEMNGQAYRVHLPPERMQIVLALAGSLGDDGALPVKKTDEYAFPLATKGAKA